MGTNTTAAHVAAIHDHLLVQSSVVRAWRDDVAVLALACAAALFVVAGVVRLARWRLAGDPHSALVGSALIVMGGLFLPVLGIAEVGGALDHRELGEALIRALASLIVAGLVLRALRSRSVHPFERPARLLPLLAVVVLAAFGALAAAEAALVQPVPHGPEAAQVISVALALGWLVLAAAVLRRDPGRPWSRRTAPSFCALALAEAAYGHQPGATLGTAVALTACMGVAALAVRSANLDLEGALHQNERTIGSLSQTLREVRGQAVELSEWRAHLVHDADNAVAGIRAALDVLDARQGASDPPAARLCRAATEEIQHLDHLLHRTADEPAAPFDVAAVVRRVALTASALGQEVYYQGDRAVAVGRPNDLVVTLKNLLVNADRHAPGSPVDLVVEQRGDQVRILCRDRGPGVDPQTAGGIFERGVRGPVSTGSGLGLHEARTLMRSQGGDLVLAPRGPGACFVATLPTAALPASPLPAPPRSVGIPAQRSGVAAQEAADTGRSVVG
jgi:signal transduction histidine kinase